MTTAQLERRVAALEKELAELKAQVAGAEPAEAPWWKQVAGIFRNDPAFWEAMRLGREYRKSLRPRRTAKRQRKD